MEALLNSGSKVNTINSVLARKLGFHIQKTNIRAQKIDSSAFKTFGMVIADFQGEDKFGRPRFFQKIFLGTDARFKMILGMFFLKIINADVSFGEGTLIWKSYITNKILLTTKIVQIVDLKVFIIAAFNMNSKTCGHPRAKRNTCAF